MAPFRERTPPPFLPGSTNGRVGALLLRHRAEELAALEVIDRYGKERGALTAVLSDESVSPVERLRRYFGLQAAALADQNYERGCLVGKHLHSGKPHPRRQFDACEGVF